MKQIQEVRTIDDIHQISKKKINVKLQAFGFSMFIIIFIVTIPLLLYKNKNFQILEAYFPNVDLLATAISWHGGPYGMWKELYRPLPIHWYNLISQTFINYMALLGLTYIITRETHKTKSIYKGWTLAFVMLLMTYLVPNHFIAIAMDKIATIIKNKNLIIVVPLLGLLIAASIIFLESKVIKYLRNYLISFGKNVINFPKKF